MEIGRDLGILDHRVWEQYCNVRRDYKTFKQQQDKENANDKGNVNGNDNGKDEGRNIDLDNVVIVGLDTCQASIDDARKRYPECQF